ncbi:MAG: amidohydrolase family protein [Balneolaceae bacterium]
MKKLWSTIRRVLFVGVFSSSILAQSNPVAFMGAQLIPISGNPIENGVLVIQDGKIISVGEAGSQIPSNAEVVDVTGKVIMPGLVDTHSHIGEGDGGDRSSSLHPDVRILDAIDPRSDTFKKALAGGLTSVNIMPGSGHLMSGQTVYLKLRKANVVEDMLLVVDDENNIYGGMKMANGTNPIGNAAPPRPGTRAKSAAMVRELFVQAQNYQQKIKDADGDESKMPPRDLQMEALVQILEGKRTVHNHTHRHDDILTAIRLSQEFGYKVVLHHVSEAWKVADEIAAADIPASIITLDSFGGKLEAIDFSNKNAVSLEKAGVLVGFHTDDYITDSRMFLRSAAMAVREGMSREKALEAVTIANAIMMDIEDRVGTLEIGKDADFIILSGDPLSVYSHVEQTWIEGLKVWDRSNPEDREYSTGGYEIFRGFETNHHLDGE